MVERAGWVSCARSCKQIPEPPPTPIQTLINQYDSLCPFYDRRRRRLYVFVSLIVMFVNNFPVCFFPVLSSEKYGLIMRNRFLHQRYREIAHFHPTDLKHKLTKKNYVLHIYVTAYCVYICLCEHTYIYFTLHLAHFIQYSYMISVMFLH